MRAGGVRWTPGPVDGVDEETFVVVEELVAVVEEVDEEVDDVETAAPLRAPN